MSEYYSGYLYWTSSCRHWQPRGEMPHGDASEGHLEGVPTVCFHCGPEIRPPRTIQIMHEALLDESSCIGSSVCGMRMGEDTRASLLVVIGLHPFLQTSMAAGGAIALTRLSELREREIAAGLNPYLVTRTSTSCLILRLGRPQVTARKCRSLLHCQVGHPPCPSHGRRPELGNALLALQRDSDDAIIKSVMTASDDPNTAASSTIMINLSSL
jgi:hypothetical protein